MTTEKKQINALKKEIQSLKKTTKGHETRLQQFNNFCKETISIAQSQMILLKNHEKLLNILEKRVKAAEKSLFDALLNDPKKPETTIPSQDQPLSISYQ